MTIVYPHFNNKEDHFGEIGELNMHKYKNVFSTLIK